MTTLVNETEAEFMTAHISTVFGKAKMIEQHAVGIVILMLFETSSTSPPTIFIIMSH